jgi:hypothetical protein
MADKRASERQGRINTEHRLAQVSLQLSQLAHSQQAAAAAAAAAGVAGVAGAHEQPGAAAGEGQGQAAAEHAAHGGFDSISSSNPGLQVYPFAPIGVLRSCFNYR